MLLNICAFGRIYNFSDTLDYIKLLISLLGSEILTPNERQQSGSGVGLHLHRVRGKFSPA